MISRLEAQKDAVTISVAYVGKSGNRTRPVVKMPWIALAEYAQNNEGIVRIDYVGATTARVSFPVNLSETGAIQFTDDETLEINVISNGPAVTLSTFEFAVSAPDYLTYSKNVCITRSN